jgi:hypothetical protein
MELLGIIIGTILFLLVIAPAQLGLILFAALIRRYVLRGASLPGALAMAHAVIVLCCLALHPTGIFSPSVPIDDDVYIPYLFVPGMHIAWIGGNVANVFGPKLQTMMSYHAAWMVCIVFIPGIVCLLLGTLQWYGIGMLWRWRHPNR